MEVVGCHITAITNNHRITTNMRFAITPNQHLPEQSIWNTGLSLVKMSTYANFWAQWTVLQRASMVNMTTFCSTADVSCTASCTASEMVCSVDSGRQVGSRLSVHRLFTISCRWDTSDSIASSWSCCHKHALVWLSVFNASMLVIRSYLSILHKKPLELLHRCTSIYTSDAFLTNYRQF